jgi:hypothetical protein
MLKNRGIGCYFVLVSAVLSIVSLIIYGTVLHKMTSVFVLTILAVVLAIVAIAGSKNDNPIFSWVTCVNAALMGLAAAVSANVMVDAIGYVVSGLNTFDTIQSYIVYLVVAVVAMVLDIIAGFLKF